jgi:hypothetical protein
MQLGRSKALPNPSFLNVDFTGAAKAALEEFAAAGMHRVQSTREFLQD